MPLRDRNGRINSFLRISRDITERKRIEALISEERGRARKYLDLAGAFFLVLDREGKVALINRKGCEILGYGEEEIIGKDWFDNFIPEKERDEIKSFFMKLVNGDVNIPVYRETPVLSKDGKERTIAWHNIVLTDEEGNITSMLGSGEDVTEQRKYEEALKARIEELERFRKVTVMRELRMKELKERLDELEGRRAEKPAAGASLLSAGK